MPISCSFRDCKALLITSLTLVNSGLELSDILQMGWPMLYSENSAASNVAFMSVRDSMKPILDALTFVLVVRPIFQSWVYSSLY